MRCTVVSLAFDEVAAVMIDSAFFDRFHAYVPGWEIPKMRPEFFTDQYGLIVDYLAEWAREMRKRSFADSIDKFFKLGNNLNQRDTIAVRRTVSGLLKLICPDGAYTKETVRKCLGYALETRRRVKEELDRVLRIFIRMNSGGTVLSYSDLLLSIAVAQWSKLDARQEIHGLVDDINRIGAGFNLSKDFVLKAGLMLADIASVGFKVENFNRANMSTLENVWSNVRRATIMTVELAASFGLAEQTLRADSALLPIAYYIFKRNPPENWLGHPSYAAERENIRSWLIRSLLKSSGIWGSGLDTLLTAIRDVIRADHLSFPGDALDKVMAARGKSLSFGPEEVEDLLDMEYGDRRLFPLLSILFPFVDVRQLHHVDHFFPKSQLQRRRLEKASCDAAYLEECLVARDRLANLQLLEGLLNVSKNDSLPGPWLEATYKDPVSRQAILDRHDLGMPPLTHQQFLPFYNVRRGKLRSRLLTLLTRPD